MLCFFQAISKLWFLDTTASLLFSFNYMWLNNIFRKASKSFLSAMAKFLLPQDNGQICFSSGTIAKLLFPQELWPSYCFLSRLYDQILLKVHKIEIFFGFDFEIFNISLLVMSKY
jgi:hypothetical protein